MQPFAKVGLDAKAFGIPTILSTVNEERGGALFKALPRWKGA